MDMEILETHHQLKCLPEFFKEIRARTKRFEVRKGDRDFSVGDYLVLREWIQTDPYSLGGYYTGEQEVRKVTYILTHDEFGEGIKRGYCVMSLE